MRKVRFQGNQYGCEKEKKSYLAGKNIDSKYRQELIDEVLPYIESGNAGLDDQLYDVPMPAVMRMLTGVGWQRHLKE